MVIVEIRQPGHTRSAALASLLILALFTLTVGVGLGIVYFALQGSVLGVALSALIPGGLVILTLSGE
jgi:hypothetical protein